jgi:hypothetical protein
LKENALASSADKPSLSWLRKVVEVVIVPVASTIFELLLFGFAAFFPAYFLEIEQPLIIYFQIVIVSISVAFFQGCRSLGYLSHIKRLEDISLKSSQLWGVIAVIPVNLMALIYFGLYSQNPVIDSAQAEYAWIFAAFLIILNSVVGAWGSQKQYLAVKQNRPKGAMGLFYPSVALMLLGWTVVFLIMIFVLRLNISLRFPR